MVEWVDFPYVAQVARVNASHAGQPRARPGATGRHLGLARLGKNTTPGSPGSRALEPDLAGYRVVWRATHLEPFWQSEDSTYGNVAEAVVKGLSKDDLFFAVQAVDKDGNASLAGFSGPTDPLSPENPTPFG